MLKKTQQEINCDACDGKGFPTVAQPAQPGRQIYPPPCKKCGGKGRLRDVPIHPKDRT